ncbi:MAG: peptide-methionine (R)-S-oxide reductase MsrB [Treponema sp.]
MKYKYLFLIFFFLFACTKSEQDGNVLGGEPMNDGLKEIYFAGGCFWGVEGYFKKVKGVVETNTGYANGKRDNTTYRELKDSDHAETVQIFYDDNVVSLQELLVRFFTIIDPTSLNKQGNDVGRQYRTGIYYKDPSVKNKIDSFIEFMQKKIKDPILVEALPLKHFVLAEEYHQDYLDKNPNGYCHINLSSANKPLDSDLNVKKLSKDKLKDELSDVQYRVTQQKDTEAPFSSEYDKLYKKGIYVDIVTGKPLFASQDKYDAGCGWPSFSRPITTDAIDYAKDTSHGMNRIEVISKKDGTHLGHVFEDGIKEKGGLRYCINGASLRFIPYEKMEEEGYGDYMIYVE